MEYHLSSVKNPDENTRLRAHTVHISEMRDTEALWHIHIHSQRMKYEIRVILTIGPWLPYTWMLTYESIMCNACLIHMLDTVKIILDVHYFTPPNCPFSSWPLGGTDAASTAGQSKWKTSDEGRAAVQMLFQCFSQNTQKHSDSETFVFSFFISCWEKWFFFHVVHTRKHTLLWFVIETYTVNVMQLVYAFFFSLLI